MARTFPLYRQLEEMDCGATCLRMVASYHGRRFSLEELRELTHLNRQGTSLLGISDAAEHIGLQTLALRTDYEQLVDEIPLPCILPWESNHFVVLYRINARYAWIADPAAGKFRLSREELLNRWADEWDDGAASGIALVLETTPDFQERDHRVDKSSWRYVLSYFRQYDHLLLQLGIGLLVGSMLQLLFPFLLKSLVDIGIGNYDLDFITLIIAAQLVLFLTQVGVEVLRRWLLLHMGVRVNVSLISDFLTKITRLPLRYFDTRHTGDLLQRVADHERLQHFLTSTTLVGVFSFFNFLAFSLVLYWWNPTVFLVFVGGTLFYLSWVFFFQRRKRALLYRRFDESAENQTRLVELINGMPEIKLHNAEKQKRWAWERVQARLFRNRVDILSLDQVQRTGGTVINEGKNLLITFLVARAVLTLDMTLGMLVAIHYIVGQLNGPVNQFVEFLRSYQEGQMSLERMNEIHLKEEEEVVTEKMTMLPEMGSLQLEDVSFRYDNAYVPNVLKNINLEIPEGQITAVVGSSGSGKTTLLKLLLGFYYPDEGSVRIGEVNLRTVHSRLWRSQCGAVLEDGYIFSDTIARNIALGEEIVDQRRLLRAVKVANMQSYIESLPLGYNTLLGHEGMGLSQGQKQRLMIARLVYKDPAYIFLDEATTSLDAYNEMLVMENILEHFRGRTIVIVAHRLSTIRHADHIVVLEGGEVVEQGTHGRLYYEHGAYYQMVRNQMELGA